MTLRGVCESHSINVTDSFANAEDEGVPHEKRTMVEKMHIKKRNTAAKLKLSEHADRMR